MKFNNEYTNVFLSGVEIALNKNSIVNHIVQTVSIISKIRWSFEFASFRDLYSGKVLTRNEIVENSTKNDDSFAIN